MKQFAKRLSALALSLALLLACGGAGTVAFAAEGTDGLPTSTASAPSESNGPTSEGNTPASAGSGTNGSSSAPTSESSAASASGSEAASSGVAESSSAGSTTPSGSRSSPASTSAPASESGSEAASSSAASSSAPTSEAPEPDRLPRAIAGDFVIIVTADGSDPVLGTDYNYNGGVLTILSGTPMTIANQNPAAPTAHRIVVANGATANLTLNGVNITTNSGHPFSVAGAVVELTVLGENRLVARGTHAAALHAPEGSALTVTEASTGSLRCEVNVVGATGAAIGGGSGEGGGNITIHGGNITAYHADGTAIGGGDSGDGGTITITGGIVIATGNNNGTGIGGGTNSNNAGGTIHISGGTVTATGGYGAGIGGGHGNNTGGAGGIINITGGTVHASSTYGAGIGGGNSFNGVGGAGGTVTISGPNTQVTASSQNGYDVGGGSSARAAPGAGGSLAVNGGATLEMQNRGTNVTTPTYGPCTITTPQGTAQYDAGGNVVRAEATIVLDTVSADGLGYTFGGSILTITTNGSYTITQDDSGTATARRVVVASGLDDVNLTLDGVNIETNSAHPFSIAGATVQLTVLNQNRLVARTSQTAALHAPQGSALTVTEDSTGSLNCSVNSSITGAAIGGGVNESGGNITIHGGTITANNINGAAIGGGFGNNGGAGGTITITGGTITATSENGAGIGGGRGNNIGGAGGIINITGGIVNASSTVGAGIGGGRGGDGAGGAGGTVTISGANTRVTASSQNGYDIGGGGSQNSTPGAGGSLEVNGGATLEMQNRGTNVTTPAYGPCTIVTPNGDTTEVYADGTVAATITLDTLTGTGGYGYTWNGSVLTITANGSYTITQDDSGTATARRVVVQIGLADVNVTLNGVNIATSANYAHPFSIAGATVELTVLGENQLVTDGEDTAALHAPAGSTLTITAASTGSLACDTSKANNNPGAAIGGAHRQGGGTITVAGGTITATSYSGAGIGGGFGGSTGGGGGNIAITGGTVEAVSTLGAGIGGGGSTNTGGVGGTIAITGGRVIASSNWGAGIGGGLGYVTGGEGAAVTISRADTEVTASSQNGYDIGGGGSYGTLATGGTLAVNNSATLEMQTKGTNATLTGRLGVCTITDASTGTVGENGYAGNIDGVYSRLTETGCIASQSDPRQQEIYWEGGIVRDGVPAAVRTNNVPAGQYVVSWQSDPAITFEEDPVNASAQFTMPAFDVEVWPVYADIATPVVGDIAAPPAKLGTQLSLTVPQVTINDVQLTDQGWQMNLPGSGWQTLAENTPMTMEYDGLPLRYFATNSVGTGYSNEVLIAVVNYTPADPAQNRFEVEGGLTQTAGQAFGITATGHRQNAVGDVVGDERYIPTTANSNPIVHFTQSGGVYSARMTILDAGSYTLTVTYQLQRWDGTTWQDVAGSIDTKTATLIVNAPPADSSTPPASDASTPAGTSPQTGDSSNLWLWVAMCVMSLAGLVGRILFIRRKHAMPSDET